MSQALSIRFQPPENLSGPARELFVSLKRAAATAPAAGSGEKVAPTALPSSSVQEQLSARTLRTRLRTLERERALKMVDGTATWIVTDRMSINSDLGERIGSTIVGAGLGTGRIVFGPPDLNLPAGLYMAIIEFRVTNMAGRRWARVLGEVILNNQKYLCQQSKMLMAAGTYRFRLPFRVRENDLLKHAAQVIEVRLNLRNVIGVEVTQVAIVSQSSGIRNLAVHPAAHLRSGANASFRWLGRRFAKARA